METSPRRVLTLDPIADPRWDRFADARPEATVFHRRAWMALLRGQYGYDFAATCVADADGTLRAGLPIATVRSRLTGTRLVAVPFSDACAPLADPAAAGARQELGAAVAQAAHDAGHGLEVRGAFPELPGGIGVARFVVHRLELGADPGALHARFRPAIRRGIAKARRAGLTAEWRTDAAALRTFYAMHVATRRRHGVPTQPLSFVLRFAGLFAEGLGAVVLVRRGPEPLAAAVFLTAGRTLTYKYGASHHDRLGARPNNLLFSEAIRWGCERGLGVLDLGRTDLDNEGLRAFKRGWGAEESELVYTYAARTPPAGGEGPARRALATAIRHGPPAFGRLVGTALYRHAG